MTKLNTLSLLNDALDEEFAWRKKELHSIKAAVSANENTNKEATFVRAAMAMLYAHWEGFIRKVGTNYLQFVYRQRLKNNEAAPFVVALSAGRVIDAAMASRKAEARGKLVEFFSTRLDDRGQIQWDAVVNTKSNLSSAVLKEIVETLALDYRPFQSREKLIDEKLLRNRNHIAHGQYLTVSPAEYHQIHGAVFEMMEEFRDQVWRCAQSAAFKR
jgi:hypothetical protein